MSTQTVNLPVVQTTFKTQAGAAVRSSTRLVYLDTLRMVLCALVIVFHTAITYGGLGDWTFVDPLANDELTSTLLTFFVILCQGFFMGLFFFVSGYFIPGSIDRKGLGHFWKDRLLRLGIPFLAYTLFLSKLPNYLYMVRHEGLQMPFLAFCRVYFWQTADAGPTWFLFALLVFSGGYTLLRLAASRRPASGAAAQLPVPPTGIVLLFALAIAAGMWAVSLVWPTIQGYRLFDSITLLLAFFPQYILLFTAGILAYRNDWLARLPGKSLKLWAGLAGLLAMATGPLFFFGGAASGDMDAFWNGLHWQSVALNLWAGLYSVSISMALILWLRDRKQRAPGKRMSSVAGSTFATYLIHPLVLVPLSFPLSYLAFHPLAKFGLVAALVVVISFAAGVALRKIPGLKAIL